MSDLAKRAIACSHWRWLPGMLQVVTPQHDGGTGCAVRYEGLAISGALPDLTDPATLGCVLALVWEIQTADPIPESDAFWAAIVAVDSSIECFGLVDARTVSALVAALEAAEGREVRNERLP